MQATAGCRWSLSRPGDLSEVLNSCSPTSCNGINPANPLLQAYDIHAFTTALHRAVSPFAESSEGWKGLIARSTLVQQGYAHQLYAISEADAAAANLSAADVVLRVPCKCCRAWRAQALDSHAERHQIAEGWVPTVMGKLDVGPRVVASWLQRDETNGTCTGADAVVPVSAPSRGLPQLVVLEQRFGASLASVLHAQPETAFDGVE